MMNRYEGTIKSAVYCPEITYRWGNGLIGYTLHIFIDLINGEAVDRKVIELNAYSDKRSERYHYKDIKTGFIKTTYMYLMSPLVIENGRTLCTERDIALDEDVTQRVCLWSLYNIEAKPHKKYGVKIMSNGTVIHRIKKAHVRDLWIAEYTNSRSSISLGKELISV